MKQYQLIKVEGMAEVENHCCITSKVISDFSQGAPVDDKVIG